LRPAYLCHIAKICLKKKKKRKKKKLKALIRHFTKEDVQMKNKHMKKCCTVYVIMEMQIKPMKFHYEPNFRMAKIQHTDNTNADKGVEGGALIHCW
jgi:hypothetical protein